MIFERCLPFNFNVATGSALLFAGAAVGTAVTTQLATTALTLIGIGTQISNTISPP